MMAHVKQLHAELMQMQPVTRDALGDCQYPGVYLFSEGENHLYAGRGKDVRERILQHSRPSVKDAPFAFRLTREHTKRKATYRPEGGCKELLNDPVFYEVLLAQKQRIARMTIRYVRADDPVTQALLEIYTATVLGARYNEFQTT
ncbi:MAG: hypothetical protein EBT61_12030 [Verrucomicrobia bacterium]|nr:hypothetical protein [Verrucomicrobiota bacterium]